MDLQSLSIFIQVAELSSFTKAGEKLGYSQPTVSFQIKQLENELGVQLFDRVGHTIKLTDAGRDALGYAQQICHTSQEMLLGKKGRENISGIVRLAMADSLCMPLVANKFSEFREKYPNISLKVEAAGTYKLFKLLEQNETDIICTLDSRTYNTNYVVVNEEMIGANFVASIDNELAQKDIVTIDDLLTQSFILTEKGMSYRRLLDENLAKYSIELHPIFENSSPDILCHLVEQNLGISFLPDYVTQKSIKEGKILKLNVENFEIDIYKQILYHKDKWVSAPMKATLNHLSDIKLI